MTLTIGIVGGAGPFAGLDLLAKILQETDAATDQNHLDIVGLLRPRLIADRTAYLLGETAVNPAHAIAAQVLELARLGAAVAAIPCNTAHAPAIFDVVTAELTAAGCPTRFLHMIALTADHLRRRLPHVARVGVLATTGTYRTGLYEQVLTPLGFAVVKPPWPVQTACVQPAIYDPVDGIKATGRSTPRTADRLLTAAHALREQGAQAIILGCTELPLALTGAELVGLPLVDPTRVLARGLIAAVAPTRLRAWSG